MAEVKQGLAWGSFCFKSLTMTGTWSLEAATALFQALQAGSEPIKVIEVLGELLRLKVTHNGSAETLSESLDRFKRCFKKSPAPTPGLLFKCASALCNEFQRSGEKSHVDQGIDFQYKALFGENTLSDMEEAQAKAHLTQVILLKRFEDFEDPEDLDIAATIIEEAKVAGLSKNTPSALRQHHIRLLSNQIQRLQAVRRFGSSN